MSDIVVPKGKNGGGLVVVDDLFVEVRIGWGESERLHVKGAGGVGAVRIYGVTAIRG